MQEFVFVNSWPKYIYIYNITQIQAIICVQSQLELNTFVAHHILDTRCDMYVCSCLWLISDARMILHNAWNEARIYCQPIVYALRVCIDIYAPCCVLSLQTSSCTLHSRQSNACMQWMAHGMYEAYMLLAAAQRWCIGSYHHQYYYYHYHYGSHRSTYIFDTTNNLEYIVYTCVYICDYNSHFSTCQNIYIYYIHHTKIISKLDTWCDMCNLPFVSNMISVQRYQ